MNVLKYYKDYMISKKQTKLMKSKIIRRNNRTLLYIKVDQKIADFFKGENLQTSSTWQVVEGNERKSSQFYSLDRRVGLGRFNDYGANNFDTSNQSYLRAVGIEKGLFFDVSDMVVSKSACESFLRNMGQVVKELYQEYLAPITIKMEVLK